MPKGQRICPDLRELIYTHHIEHNRTPYEIHHLLFNRDNTRCTLKYLTDICSRITDDEHFSTQYLNGGAKQSGRPLSLDYLHRSLICGQIQLDKHRHVVTMFHNYCLMLFPDDEDLAEPENRLSLSTFKRTLKRGGFSRKIMERRHINQDPMEGVRFLETIEHINPMCIIDVDETKSNPESFFQKYGYAPIGDECLKEQIMINGTAYCTIAAVSPLGFVCWQIFEGNIGHEEFINFINISLEPFLIPDNVVVLDNATSHHFPDSRIALEAVLNGNYFYSARYSPHLKPIEPCFALVKNWLRNHEDEAVQNPVGTINRAFNLYSIGGENAQSVRGHWNGYFANNAAFLEQLNI